MQNHCAVRIAGTATALPQHVVTREEVKFYLGRVFPLDGNRLEGMMAVVDNAQVERRYTIHPVEYTVEPRPLGRISEEYKEHAIRLGSQAAKDCLAEAGLRPEQIDLLITVSCTGVMIPSLDAHLINEMGFRSDVRRLPITEIGCAAGAAAMGQAWEFVRASPDRNALLVCVELPSLTFQRGNMTQANLISSILFGDGAAAAALTGGDGAKTGRGARGPEILGTESYLFPNSTAAMGFDLDETGLHIVLSKDVPQMIREKIAGLVDGFLARHGLRREKVAAFILHPGGQKLLAYIEEELGLKRDDTQPSWDVLRNYGNLSSASILFVLREWLTKRPARAGEYGLMAAFGPGFSAEMLLVRW